MKTLLQKPLRLLSLLTLLVCLGACQQDQELDAIIADEGLQDAATMPHSTSGTVVGLVSHSDAFANRTYLVPAGPPVWLKTAEQVTSEAKEWPRMYPNAPRDMRWTLHPSVYEEPLEYDFGKYPLWFDANWETNANGVFLRGILEFESYTPANPIVLEDRPSYIKPGIFFANYEAPAGGNNNDGPFIELLTGELPSAHRTTSEVELKNFEAPMNGYCAGLFPVNYQRRHQVSMDDAEIIEYTFPTTTYQLVIFTKTKAQAPIRNHPYHYWNFPYTEGTIKILDAPPSQDINLFTVIKNGDPIPGSMKRTNIPRTTN